MLANGVTMKKFIFSLFLFIGLVCAAYSEDGDILYYENSEMGYGGYVVSMYLGNMEDFGIYDNSVDPAEILEIIETAISANFDMVDSLTDEEYWLKSEALEQYGVEAGEFYLTLLLDDYDSDEGLAIITCYTYDGTSWIGFYIDEDSVSELDSLF